MLFSCPKAVDEFVGGSAGGFLVDDDGSIAVCGVVAGKVEVEGVGKFGIGSTVGHKLRTIVVVAGRCFSENEVVKVGIAAILSVMEAIFQKIGNHVIIRGIDGFKVLGLYINRHGVVFDFLSGIDTDDAGFVDELLTVRSSLVVFAEVSGIKGRGAAVEWSVAFK